MKLFTGTLALYISKYSYDEIYEIRLRLNRPVVLKTKAGTVKLRHESGRYYIVTKEDIDRVVGVSIFRLLGDGGTRVRIFKI